jgi:hypothetical protein
MKSYAFKELTNARLAEIAVIRHEPRQAEVRQGARGADGARDLGRQVGGEGVHEGGGARGHARPLAQGWARGPWKWGWPFSAP